MSNKKKRKNTGQRSSAKVSPHQRVNDPEKAAVISKLVQSMVKPPETLGQHIKRLGVRALSVDVDGEPCIALPLKDLVKVEMAEIAKERDRKKEHLSTELGIVDNSDDLSGISDSEVVVAEQLSLFGEDDYPVSSVTG